MGKTAREFLLYSPDEDFLHGAGPDEAWQESHLLTWYDDKAGIGGFYRLGQEPNRRNSSVLCGVVTRDGARFRHNSDNIPLREQDRRRDFYCAGNDYRLHLRPQPTIEVDTAELRMSLAVEDYHPLHQWWSVVVPGTHAGLDKDMARHHHETAGRIRGDVALGGKRYEVDGLVMRDHSWGNRKWHIILAHRWIVANFGHDLSLAMIVFVLQDGSMPFHGQMYRNGRMHSLVSGHIVLDMEADGVSYAGARARVVADDGSEIALEMSLVDALIFTTHGLTINEAICIARTADGREGFALVESINNPRNGSDGLVRVVRSTLEDGLSYRETP